MNISIITILGLLVLGIVAGMSSSLVGIGGGIIVVPALVFIFGVNQKMATGTSLLMLLPPIGILAVVNYYKAGYTDIKVACILIAGFLAGTVLGSKVALNLEESTLKRIFGLFLALMAVKYLFYSK
jgi:uncharacterized protein